MDNLRYHIVIPTHTCRLLDGDHHVPERTLAACEDPRDARLVREALRTRYLHPAIVDKQTGEYL